MSLDIRLSMDETALAPFRAAWSRAAGASQPLDTLTATARAHHAELAGVAVPAYLRSHIDLVPELADLLSDDDWQLDADARDGLAGALSYFNDPSDLIPDGRPNFGLLDDAIVIELALAENRRDWMAWQEFAALRRRLPSIGRMDRRQWAELRRDVPKLIRLANGDASYLQSRYGWNNGRSEYRLIADLPRYDMLLQ